MKKDFETTQRTSALQLEQAPTASLVIIRGEPIGQSFELRSTPLVIGRSPECGIQLAEDSVSRRHCQIWRRGEKVLLRDLGATNQTLVNEAPVSEVDLVDGDHIAIGRVVLKFIAGGVEAEYHNELYQRASLDPLTSLANRRRIEHELEEAIRRCRQEGALLSLAIIDVDRFKRINDRYDHLIGDRVLQDVAETLQRLAADGDLTGRFGGEEFAMIMRCDLEAATRRAEGIRAEIADHSFITDEGPLKVTVSAGVSSWSPAMDDYRMLVREADRALLRAKSEGRNCVRQGR